MFIQITWSIPVSEQFNLCGSLQWIVLQGRSRDWNLGSTGRGGSRAEGAGVPGGWAGVAGQSAGPQVRSLQPWWETLWVALHGIVRVQQGVPTELGGGQSQYLTCTGGRRRSACAAPVYWLKGEGISSEAQQSQPVPSSPSCPVLLSAGAKAPTGLLSVSQPPAAPLPPLFTSCSLLLTCSHLAFAFQHRASTL